MSGVTFHLEGPEGEDDDGALPGVDGVVTVGVVGVVGRVVGGDHAPAVGCEVGPAP